MRSAATPSWISSRSTHTLATKATARTGTIGAMAAARAPPATCAKRDMSSGSLARGSSMPDSKVEHALIVKFFHYGEKFSQDLSALFALEDELEAALEQSEAGEVDGNEIAVNGADGFIFMYGPDADEMFKAVEQILRTSEVTKGGQATLRFGNAEDA